jgi:hypothetical protein
MVTNENSSFWAMISNEASLHGCLKSEFFLFHHLHVEREDYVLSPPWWKPHKIQFPNFKKFVA